MKLDTFNEIVGHGINIYGSRERIRGDLIANAKKYLQLEGIQENIYKTSLVSYIVDTLSILSANQLFYDSVIYREFFMVEAQFQESVYNLARWIGYNVPKTTPAVVDVVFKIPLTFNSEYVTFTIPGTFKTFAGKIPFTIDSGDYNIPAATFNLNKEEFKEMVDTDPDLAAGGKIINNTALMVRDGKGFIRPVYITPVDPNAPTSIRYATFALPFKQHERKVYQFIVPDSIQAYQFYSKFLEFEGMVSSARVWVIEPNVGEKFQLDTSLSQQFNPDIDIRSVKSGTTGNVYKWEEWYESSHGIYTMAANSKQFVFVGGDNKAEIFFGNGIVGKQPSPNSIITIELYITHGENGITLPNTITKADQLYYTVNQIRDNQGQVIESDITTKLHSILFTVFNPNSPTGALDIPSLPEIKRSAIINLRSKGKLVSELDYDDINTIMGPNFPTVEAFPILKRSDIKVNEILAFLRLLYYDEYSLPQIIPTRNIKATVTDYPTQLEDNSPSSSSSSIIQNDTIFNSKGQYSILRTSKFLVDNEYYETMLNLTIDRATMTATYDYIAKNIFGSPVSLYSDSTPCFYIQYIYTPITGVDFDVTLEEDSSSSSSQPMIYSGNKKYPLNIKVHVNHIPVSGSEDLKTTLRARMITKWGSNQQYSQLDRVNGPPDSDIDHPIDYDKIETEFNFKIDNYLEVPPEIQRFEFHIDCYGILRDTVGNYLDENGSIVPLDENNNPIGAAEGWMPLQSYYCDVLIRKDLSDVMKSEVTKLDILDGNNQITSTEYTIHNIPAILSSYIEGITNRPSESINQTNFEIVVMQKLLQNLGLEERRMMTDFINIKFPDTHGILNNLKYNPVDHEVISRYKTPFNLETPTDIEFKPETSSSSSSSDDSGFIKYIVNGAVSGYENIPLSTYIDSIAEWFPGDGGNGVWYLIKPKRGMYVRVLDELDSSGRDKIIAYDGNKWIDVQSFTIPLVIKLKVEMDPTKTMSESKLKDEIKYQLMSHFSPNMGIQKRMDRSEIVTVVRATPGVLYCELVEPAIDIRFDYNIKDLTQYELMDYTPQYVGWLEDSIEIEIVNKI